MDVSDKILRGPSVSLSRRLVCRLVIYESEGELISDARLSYNTK